MKKINLTISIVFTLLIMLLASCQSNQPPKKMTDKEREARQEMLDEKQSKREEIAKETQARDEKLNNMSDEQKNEEKKKKDLENEKVQYCGDFAIKMHEFNQHYLESRSYEQSIDFIASKYNDDNDLELEQTSEKMKKYNKLGKFEFYGLAFADCFYKKSHAFSNPNLKIMLKHFSSYEKMKSKMTESGMVFLVSAMSMLNPSLYSKFAKASE